MFVPPTRDSILVKNLQATERTNNQGRKWGVKFIERRGTTVSSVLTRSYPWQTQKCGDRNCFPCSSVPPGRTPKTSCRVPGVGYVITCQTCEEGGKTASYQGETGRTGHQRGQEHKRDMINKAQTCPMVQHAAQAHQGEQEPTFKMRIVKTFQTAMERQIDEAKRIE